MCLRDTSRPSGRSPGCRAGRFHCSDGGDDAGDRHHWSFDRILNASRKPMCWNLERILKGAARHKASDVHLVCGLAPVFRIQGEMSPIAGEPLDPQALKAIFEESSTVRQREIFEKEWQLCFSRQAEGVGRYRARETF